ncbi:type VI secretion system contractile sheath small subunit, partial [Leptospira borgpetersenii serovar Hardjo-bovis]|nr:type VI secretion system contractile sheath small subunit [Leptospira borgpetersenii serovar Hardjo-bovis]
DLAGKPREELPPVTDRKFLDIDIDNFNERMKAIAPRVAFAVPNTLTGEGQLMVDITLENTDDFSPAQIARKVDALNHLLEVRSLMARHQSSVDGKARAEFRVKILLQDPTLLITLANAPKEDATHQDVSADKQSAK